MRTDVREAQLTDKQRKELIDNRTFFLFWAVYAVLTTVCLVAFIVCQVVYKLNTTQMIAGEWGFCTAPFVPALAVAAVYYAKATWWQLDS